MADPAFGRRSWGRRRPRRPDPPGAADSPAARFFAAGSSAAGSSAAGSSAAGSSAAGPSAPLPEQVALTLLAEGEMEVAGRLVDASNATLYCIVRHAGREAACVYKPVAGERPLWDFPAGSLAGREVAAYQVSRTAGWDVAPPTVFRDGPFGPGMCQLWIDIDESVDLLALARSRDHPALREMAVFDAVVNNADRKVGHLLPAPGGHLYGCDHGVCFGAEYKLRTVLWQWRGDSLTQRSITALTTLQDSLDGAGPGGKGTGGAGPGGGGLAADLGRWLRPAEVSATRRRIDLLLAHRVHPYPSEDWPAVPWPPI